MEDAIEVVFWIALGIAVLYLVVRIGIAWLVPRHHGD
jgi:hypothetical protein